jgi:hypothetical protein
MYSRKERDEGGIITYQTQAFVIELKSIFVCSLTNVSNTYSRSVGFKGE